MVSAFLGWLILGEAIGQRFVMGVMLVISVVMFSIFEKSKVPSRR
jgi:drug/metabolite transporter (DMT)-like permease